MDAYAGRAITVSTRHGKERAFSPAIDSILGARLLVPPDLDTDRLGTFSGEVERASDALTTARRKAELGMAVTGAPLGLATEGSFGPDPMVPFMAVHHELVLFLDRERGLEVVEELATVETNFAHRVVASPDELDDFLDRVGFPDHGVIVRPAGPVVPGSVHKDLLDHAAVAHAVRSSAAAAVDGMAHVETDMRAHRNPSRMRVLATIAERLARRLATPCPACGAPGFGAIETLPGLPCAWCGLPTNLARGERHGCAACPETLELPRRDGLREADPGSCPRCNP